jgi:hypothetical protein
MEVAYYLVQGLKNIHLSNDRWKVGIDKLDL